jgi:hypothetical protein
MNRSWRLGGQLLTYRPKSGVGLIGTTVRFYMDLLCRRSADHWNIPAARCFVSWVAAPTGMPAEVIAINRRDFAEIAAALSGFGAAGKAVAEFSRKFVVAA